MRAGGGHPRLLPPDWLNRPDSTLVIYRDRPMIEPARVAARRGRRPLNDHHPGSTDQVHLARCGLRREAPELTCRDDMRVIFVRMTGLSLRRWRAACR